MNMNNLRKGNDFHYPFFQHLSDNKHNYFSVIQTQKRWKSQLKTSIITQYQALEYKS